MSSPKESLLSRIYEVRNLLNGDAQPGKRATFGPGFKMSRYVIILFAATTIKIFSEQTENIKGSMYFNFYRLQKVASRLQLEFDRTKIARKIYSELQDKGEVATVIEENKTFVTLTEKGKQNCQEKLQELCELNRLFLSEPSSTERFLELGRDVGANYPKSSNRKLTKKDMAIDALIKNISSW
jgi:hypothetical protein